MQNNQPKPALIKYSQTDAVRALEVGLAELLQTLFSLRKAREEDAQENCVIPEFKAITIEELMQENHPATKIDKLVNDINRFGITQIAVINSVRAIGEALNQIGGNELMLSVAERVSDEPLLCYGHKDRGSDFQKQMSVLNAKWDGIGTWMA